MVGLSFRSNVKAVTRHLSSVQKKQVPFATARALTWTAQDMQKGIIAQIARVFNSTKKWWLKQQPTGIKIISAKKTRLIATVYTKAYFAFLQEEGGTKRPHQSSSLLIPTAAVPKTKKKAGGATAMLRQPTVFSDKRGVFRRTGGKKRKNQKLKLLFHRDTTAHIKPVFEFKKTAARVAARTFMANFYKSLERALKTAK